MRGFRRWLLVAAGVIVVAVVGGPFVYIHFIEGKAPAPLSITGSGDTTSSTAGEPAAGTVTGRWSVGRGSLVGYRVQEVLFGQSATAVGRTSAVTGSITIAGTTVTAATFTADMTKVRSDRSQRDEQFQGRIMNTAQFPDATFTLTKSIALGEIPPAGTVITEEASGSLTLHGTTNAVSFEAKAERTGSTIEINGEIPIVFADYGIDNPSLGGVVTTQDHGTLEFLLDLAHS